MSTKFGNYFNPAEVTEGQTANKGIPGGYNINGEESVRTDPSELGNFKYPSRAKALGLAQARLNDPELYDEIEGWTNAFKNGGSEASMPWVNNTMNTGEVA